MKQATEGTAAPSTGTFDFEAAMNELEGVVSRLEGGDLPLEDALAAFERGVALTRACRNALAAAEQKVELLSVRSDGTVTTGPFDGESP